MELSKDNILRTTDKGLTVFRHYIAIPFQLGRNFLNPLYEDKHASCNIFFDRRNDCYRLKDFGNDDYSGDCFAFVGKLNGLDCRSPKDFIQIMTKINSDLHLCLAEPVNHSYKHRQQISSSPSKTPKEPTQERPYSIQQSCFSTTELSWWKQYGISERILKQYKVVSLKRFDSLNKDGNPFLFSGFGTGAHVRIYRAATDKNLSSYVVYTFCSGREKHRQLLFRA